MPRVGPHLEGFTDLTILVHNSSKALVVGPLTSHETKGLKCVMPPATLLSWYWGFQQT